MKWQWKGTNNEPSLMSNDDCPGMLTVTPTNDPPISLKRIEPTEAERQLGIRLPMDGSWHAEFEYRKKQMK